MPIQRWSDQIWVVQLATDPAFSDELDSLREQAASAQPQPDIVLDFSEATNLNSSNLSQLLRLRKDVTDREARLRLAGPPDHVWAIFLATGLDKVFDFATDTSTALAELQIDS